LLSATQSLVFLQLLLFLFKLSSALFFRLSSALWFGVFGSSLLFFLSHVQIFVTCLFGGLSEGLKSAIGSHFFNLTSRYDSSPDFLDVHNDCNNVVRNSLFNCLRGLSENRVILDELILGVVRNKIAFLFHLDLILVNEGQIVINHNCLEDGQWDPSIAVEHLVRFLTLLQKHMFKSFLPPLKLFGKSLQKGRLRRFLRNKGSKV